MAYHPGQAPTDLPGLSQFVNRELQNIARSIAEGDQVMRLQVSHTPPRKYGDGCIVLADGANWNPGAGAGPYIFYANSWHKLG